MGPLSYMRSVVDRNVVMRRKPLLQCHECYIWSITNKAVCKLDVNLSHLLVRLTLNLLTTTIVAPPSNASKWQMGFNSAFEGLNTTMDA